LSPVSLFDCSFSLLSSSSGSFSTVRFFSAFLAALFSSAIALAAYFSSSALALASAAAI
jgi:hypothetical protein